MSTNYKGLSITFYKYYTLKNLDDERQDFYELLERCDVKGKIIIANEGINGAVAGKTSNVKDFMHEIKKFPGLSKLNFRITKTNQECFKRRLVKIRPELVPLGKDEISPKTLGGGKTITPTQLKQWYEQGKDFKILDARNDYEYEIGRFKNSLNPNITKFRDFKNSLEKFKDLKNKPIVTFCTGGIRCEKASALMKEKGFEKVYKLEGGVIEFMKVDTHKKYWDGELFVFDKRETITHKDVI